MKRQIQTIILFVLVSLFSLASFNAQSENIKTLNGEKAQLEFLSKSDLNLKLVNTVGEVTLDGIGRYEGDFVKLIVEGYGQSYTLGSPNLPVNRRLIEIPFNAEPVIKIISYELKEYDLADYGATDKIIPVQPPQPKCGNSPDFSCDLNVYNTNDYIASQRVTVDVLGVMRGVRIARINVYPVEYNPVQNKIRVYENLVFEITFKNADLAQTEWQKQKNFSPYFKSIFRNLANYSPVENRDNLTTYPIKYLVVSDRMFETQLQPFISWKKRKGFTVVEAYTDDIGGTKEAIKTYIQSLYDAGTEEDPAPSFVLFVGDIAQMPTWNNGNGVTDRNYVEYTGDLFPEIFYGRFSAENEAQLQPYIDKTLQYEQYTMPDPSYLEEVVMVAGMDGSHGADWANGQINYGTINYFNEDHDILSHTYLYPVSGSSDAQIIGDISNGVTFANYTAHCSAGGWADPSFSIGDIPTLQNQDKYGLLIGNCCSSSEYQTTCFAEEILRAENKGAVGYIGGSNSTYWDEDYYFGVGVGQISENPPPYEETTLGNYDRSFHDHGEVFGDWYTTQDQIVFAGNLAVSESGSSAEMYYWDIYNLMGDPSLMVYYGVPGEIQADHNSVLMIGQSEFEVQTEPFTYVAMNFDGNNIATGLADENGDITLTFESLSTPGTVELVYTAQNFQPKIEELMIIAPNGPFCVYSGYTINDDSLGNGNSYPEYNEQVLLSITIENFGNQDAVNAVTTIETENPYVSLIDAQETIDTIKSNQSVTLENGFLIQLADNIPDQTDLNFQMTVTDEQDSSWSSEFSVLAYAPVLASEKITVVDDSNENGILEPGETAILKVRTVNDGHCPALDVHASLIAYNQYITVLSGDTVFPILGTGIFGAVFPEFEVQVSEDAPEGIFGEMHYQLTAGSYEMVNTYYQKVGLLIEDWETGNMDKFNWQMGGDGNWDINSNLPFDGLYDLKSGSINNDQNTSFSINYEVMSYDSIIFYKRVSSEEDYDFLNFYIDDILKGSWSGIEQNWSRQSYAVSPGMHTFKWDYEKDYSQVGGMDCGFVDNIMLPTMMMTTVYAGPDDAVCNSSENFQCMATATNYDTFHWSTTGTGTFDDEHIFDAQYSFSQEDIDNSSVQLVLNVVDLEGYPVSDTMTLEFYGMPEQPALPVGPEQVDLNEVSQSDYSTEEIAFSSQYLWTLYPEEAGFIEDDGISATVSWDELFYGNAFVKVAAVNDCGMGEFSDSLQIIVTNPVGIYEENEEFGLSILPNPNNGIFSLSISTVEKQEMKLQVLNFLGQSVLQPKTMYIDGNYNENIDLSGSESGIYLVVLQNGNSSLVKKLVINK